MNVTIPEPVLWIVGTLVVLYVSRFVIALYRIGHMDTTYRDQITWAWQEFWENRRYKTDLTRVGPHGLRDVREDGLHIFMCGSNSFAHNVCPHESDWSKA